ncbi:bifunctional UDP-N-acetylglucosamine diphosphorylase/glucosamine-1-phosphate N-acetyltransferase GlmU [Shimia litoralis]|uniref:Bifunctional protein GlmU n=1 Tax=Shimia litoralis TaxID=420403 RepID=A0A4U7N765_9RHOB|nr:bifunctional UDP-N-acetylglucosamine diphosphorylase/glucosamine-1-phosphate N-acetyltransferase GlmU [Shimia litoralis]TKZ21742.1 bifunctional UDP-N-acetylglucosamine diphosphorylase/glucosamine-1-phosphate N-acetyltransferase GlmU [Shimia litoralis]
MSIALVILGAGKGTRMKSDLPKVLHQIAGAPMLVHAMKAGAVLEPARTVVVAGHGYDHVKAAVNDFDPDATIVMQAEQKGTAHAVDMARDALSDFDGDVIVLFGDTPFVRPETLEKMAAARGESAVVVLGFEAADPGKYGRLVMNGSSLEAIVEFADASDEQRAITFCNSGVMLADREALFAMISAVEANNAQDEYYLTDIVGIAHKNGLAVTAVACDEEETLGVNSRVHLSQAEAIFQNRARLELMENGITLQQPDSVMLSHDTVIGRDTIVEPNVYFGPGVTVESGAHIRAFSHLEGCHVARDSVVGPYARLRPGAELAEGVKIGNFVEVKNAQLEAGAKINHLSYIGDATIGADTNVGAGTITCNYDGVMKHHTTIGARAFIGSSTMLVAPVQIGDDAMTASGSVITKDVPAEALALGRAKQVNKSGLAVKLFEMLKLTKAKRDLESK